MSFTHTQGHNMKQTRLTTIDAILEDDEEIWIECQERNNGLVLYLHSGGITIARFFSKNPNAFRLVKNGSQNIGLE
jgi:hypothetical protein